MGAHNILVVNTEKTWRGGERQTLYNILGYLDKGLHVELLCRQRAPLAARASGLGINVHEVPGAGAALWWLITNGSTFDLLHAQTAKAQTLAVLSRLFHRRPVVYTRRVDFVPHGALTRLKYRLTEQVVAISTPVKRILEDFGVPNVTTIYDTVVPREIDRERAVSLVGGIAGGRKVIATIAALVQHKDPLTMVDAIHRLSQLRDDFVFLHFGEGPLKDQVQQKIMEYHLESVYHQMGYVSDVEDVFSVLSAFCMSSEEEGLGSSVLDAFVYRVPVVSTDAGGLAEIVAGHGTLCPRKDGAALAAGLDRVLSSPEETQAVVEAAYHYAVSAHSLESTTDQYLSLFSGISGGNVRFSGPAPVRSL